MSAVKRSWLAEWRSHEWGWNQREGKRFSTREKAINCAMDRAEEGCYDIRVWWAPIIPDPEDPAKIVWRYIEI